MLVSHQLPAASGEEFRNRSTRPAGGIEEPDLLTEIHALRKPLSIVFRPLNFRRCFGDSDGGRGCGRVHTGFRLLDFGFILDGLRVVLCHDVLFHSCVGVSSGDFPIQHLYYILGSMGNSTKKR